MFGKHSKEELQKIHAKCGKTRKEREEFRRTFAEAFEVVLRRKIKNAKTPEGEQMTVMDRLVDSVIERVLANGDVKAFECIRDTVGEKPVEKVQEDVVHTVMPVVEIDGVELKLAIGEDVDSEY